MAEIPTVPTPAPAPTPVPAQAVMADTTPKSKAKCVVYQTPEQTAKIAEIMAESLAGGEAKPDFNYRFTRDVLNAPPMQDEVLTENDGTVHVPLNVQTAILDEIFHGQWGASPVKISSAVKGVNTVPISVFSVVVWVEYPLTGLRRTFPGASDSNMKQNTASEAMTAMAIKNAISKIGKRFGAKYIYAKLDRTYNEEGSTTKAKVEQWK